MTTKQNPSRLNYLAIFAALITFIFIRNPSFASDSKQPLTFDFEYLNNDQISKDLRTTFDKYSHQSKQEALMDMLSVKPKQLKLFKEKFMVLKVTSGDFGGYFLHIIINPKKVQFWTVWIYKISEPADYQVRMIKEHPITKKDVDDWKILDEENLKFWL